MPAGVQSVRNALDRVLPPGPRDSLKRSVYGARQSRLVPPASLRHRVSGSTDIGAFQRAGMRCAVDLMAAAERHLESPPSHVLDFGVGCGRTVRWLLEWWPQATFTGADIDLEALAWIDRHLRGVNTVRSDRRPPLFLADSSFDLVYAVSVFTHLDVPDQDAWLAEISRLLAPGALALLTVHTAEAVGRLTASDEETLATAGHVFVEGDLWEGVFPHWYQTSVHTERYVRDHFSRWLDVLEVVPRGVNGHQDLVVLRRRR